MSINRFGYLFKSGLKGVFSHGFRSFASVTVIAACLIIMGTFALVGVNVDSIIKDMESNSQILAFVDESVSREDAKLLEGPIRTLRNVRDVKFVTREEAMEKYKANFDDTSIFDGIDAQVFGPVHLGWSLRYKQRLSHKDGVTGKTWYIPGYGTWDSSALGGTFNLIIDI